MRTTTSLRAPIARVATNGQVTQVVNQPGVFGKTRVVRTHMVTKGVAS